MDKVIEKYIACFILGMVVMGVLVLQFKPDDEQRIERLEKLMEFKEYRYGVHVVHENMTLAEIRKFYNGITYPTYKMLFTGLVVDYVCDGTTDSVFNFIK